MGKVIKCQCLADGSPGPAGQYLKAYDAKTGESEWTLNVAEALTFPSPLEAHRLWASVLPSQPIRPWDGKPNRPLTAFTIWIEDADDAGN
jgi:hypothetical protein